ncbi:MAG: uroporphyrinogen decarboxylase [Eubacteriaceae bacterium]|nr:uroporphyrinogen decarboxylase [Eubacteriaceae bacterium]
MLTKRQNLMETIKGGNPDRYVNQYEFMELIVEVPLSGKPAVPGKETKDTWGVTKNWPEGQLAAFPVHDEAHTVLKDITKWKEVLVKPSVKYPEEAWAAAIAHANAVDRNEKFVTSMFTTGVFERLHFLMGMEDALMNFYEEPEAVHELIELITEYELDFAKEVIEHIHPDALFHHDDWGSGKSTFIAPAMFEEFILPAYQKIYGFYKENGVEVIVHHSDSYAATLVPYMIEMGMDIWQGVMTTNNIPELIKAYGGKLTFMGGLDNGQLDKADWSREEIAKYVEKACKENGKKFFIPCLIMGGPSSLFPEVYVAVSEEIDRMSKEIFA